jgi:restriction system protein
MRKPISKLFLPKNSDHGQQIGAVRHPGGGHAGSPRRAEAHDKNETLRSLIHALETILETGVARDAHVGVGDWRREPTLADLPEDLRELTPPDHEQFKPEHLGMLEQFSSAARAHHTEAVEAGEARYRQAVSDWEHASASQAQAIADLRAEVEAHNHRLEELERALRAGEPETVEWYAGEVLTHSPYPKRLARRVEVSLDRATGTLNVRLGIPPFNLVVPAVEAFKYVKPTDEIKEIERSSEERAALYERVEAQLVLRSLHEIFSTDASGTISGVAFWLDIVAADPSTGRDTVTPQLSLMVTKSAFAELDLSRVDPIACLQRLTTTAS